MDVETIRINVIVNEVLKVNVDYDVCTVRGNNLHVADTTVCMNSLVPSTSRCTSCVEKHVESLS